MAIKNGVITNTKLGTATVKADILPNGRCIPGRRITITHITIHDTGNTAPAKNQHNYLKNNNRSGSNPKASWHFSVDDTQIIQAVRTDREAWHAGHRTGNGHSIGIEISQRTSASAQKQAYLNAIELVKVLMNAYGVPASRVVRHKDWTGKDCPYNMNHKKYGYDWTWFKRTLSAPSKPATKRTIDTALVYANDVDKVRAEILLWKKPKSVLLNVKDINKYHIKHVYAIGVVANQIGNAEVKIQGRDRYDTVQKVLNFKK